MNNKSPRYENYLTVYSRRNGQKRQITHGVDDCKVLLKALNYYSLGLEHLPEKFKEAYKIDDINAEDDNVMRMIRRIISHFPEFEGFTMTETEAKKTDNT